MKFKLKLFILNLIPVTLAFGGVIFYFVKYQIIFFPSFTVVDYLVLLIGVLIFLVLSFIAALYFESMVNYPFKKIRRKTEILEKSGIDNYKIEEDVNPLTKDITAALNNAVLNLKKYKTQVAAEVEQKNKQIEEINQKLQVDEKAALEVFKELKKIDKMKTEFISLASHQLRTPLVAIRWGLEALKTNKFGSLNAKQAEYVEDIYKSNDRMIKLVGNLLNVSRIESKRFIIDPKPTNLKTLAIDVISEVGLKAQEKHQKILLEVDDDLVEINIDPNLARHVFMNLLTNAIKYSPESSEIKMIIEQQETSILTKVVDHGIGIPEESREKIFSKFYRADNARKAETDGTGIGLYLAKAVVEAMNGQIGFETKVGEGTTFWFTLPLAGIEAKDGEVTITEV